MYFQNIDEKEQCIGHYCNGQLSFEAPDTSNLSRTWKYANSLERNSHIEYGWIYALGAALDQVCPPHLKESWQQVTEKLDAYSRSLRIAKINLEENCIFDLIPNKVLVQYLDMKNRITKSVFENFSRPQNYDHLVSAAKIIEKIKYQNVNLDYGLIRRESYDTKVRRFSRDLKKCKRHVSYKLFGSKTGRLTTDKGSFPILTLDRDLRKFLLPNNDLFVEVDFNAAELRTLLALSGKEQPPEDIHEWNANNIFENKKSREESKKRVFSWLYNPSAKDLLLNEVYDRDLVKRKYWDGRKVTTPFSREIEADEYHSVNYVLQSTTSDLFLEQVSKIYDILKSRKSKIAFLMHDSVILDFAAEE